ncbi:hypothetical protein L6452_10185 [Arctium lappa]|uniref:Uncharacterized protein n=1 Tax=Arctium lappa TaxID=4217 RepID=A0ACB9DLT9_ARCLA|nr:hypothetical protein L6452_10185 [Arctium lappa]
MGRAKNEESEDRVGNVVVESCGAKAWFRGFGAVLFGLCLLVVVDVAFFWFSLGRNLGSRGGQTRETGKAETPGVEEAKPRRTSKAKPWESGGKPGRPGAKPWRREAKPGRREAKHRRREGQTLGDPGVGKLGGTGSRNQKTRESGKSSGPGRRGPGEAEPGSGDPVWEAEPIGEASSRGSFQ